MRKVLQGKRILLVEDELLAALDIAEMVADLGAEVIGPIATLDEAMAVAEREPIDGAILDVKLDHTFTTPLVLALARRNVPTLLSTGYERVMLPEELADLPKLTKPYDEASLLRAAEIHLVAGAETG